MSDENLYIPIRMELKPSSAQDTSDLRHKLSQPAFRESLRKDLGYFVREELLLGTLENVFRDDQVPSMERLRITQLAQDSYQSGKNGSAFDNSNLDTPYSGLIALFHDLGEVSKLGPELEVKKREEEFYARMLKMR